MPELLLLTNRFPYGVGEEYLEAELPHLAACFDRVVVVPTMHTRGSPRTRPLPPGVVAVPLDLPPGRTGRAATPARAVVRGSVGPGLAHLPGPLPRRPGPLLYEAYFEARAQEVAHRATARLGAAGLEVPEVVYAYWFYVTARVGTLLAARRPAGRAVVVARAHGYDVNVEASPLGYLPQRELLLRELDRLHPVSSTAAHRLTDRWPAYAHKVSVRRLGSSGSSPEPVARQHPLHVLTVSTVRPLKRLTLVAAAVRLLQGRGVPVRWTHLGGGTPRAMAGLTRSTAGLAAGTVDLLGAVPHEQVLRWYAAHRPSVLVNVSTSEGVPVSVMEAMAHGVPVVATDVGGTRELLADQPELAMLEPDVDAEGLARALDHLRRLPPAAYERVCRDNQARWRAGWDARTVFADFAHELVSLARGSAP